MPKPVGIFFSSIMISLPQNNQLIMWSDRVDFSNRHSGPILWRDLSLTICFLVLKEMRGIHHQLKTKGPWTPPGCNIWSGFSEPLFLPAKHTDPNPRLCGMKGLGESFWPQLTIKPHHTLDSAWMSHQHPNGDVWWLCL